ncbi:hypothetical protein GGTG_03626 [Gaeumannomyces tritici R3-111a-1]|uniref:lytic cellulose monooxygenase (C4-dehydrogenating) n=1 Tax=Gaeumannomyces tritici (strain R3-111a-1) TaxID=644352 RepID=J3NQS0_GAET3|nr:hypothetical protein GGTG_03626 [Gaeumannomyces tritici R3-111a-1]EJT78526.1 hypothetical protein GGTG_03626 [Gaeumannomyces tritici R3-111a-1]
MKYSLSYALAAASALAPLAAAHATFQQLWVNGVDQDSKCARLPPSNSPVEDVSSNNMRCNANPAAAAGSCAVRAGDVVAVEMHQHNNRDCAQEAIGGNHYGPVMVYLSKVADAAKADGSSPFFKIFESGYFAGNKTWGNDLLNANCGRQNVVIPADITPGDYLLRAETVALHVAGSRGGAQFYMTCYQIRVTGSGSATPAGVPFPGAYSAADPGILVNIHNGLTSYTIPGPAVYSAGAGTGGSNSSAPAVSSTSMSGPGSVPTTFLTRTSSRAPATSTSSAPVSTALPDDDSCDGLPANSTVPAPAPAPTSTSLPGGAEDDEECDAEPGVSSTSAPAPSSTSAPGSGAGGEAEPVSSTASPAPTGAPAPGNGSGGASPAPTTTASSSKPAPTIKDVDNAEEEECDAEPEASSTAAAAAPTATSAPATGDDDECDAEPVSTSTSASASAAASTTVAPSGADDECDAEPTATTTSAPAPTGTDEAEECDT